MSVVESMSIAVFMMLVVFSVLFGLYLCIKAFSFVCAKVENQTHRSNG